MLAERGLNTKWPEDRGCCPTDSRRNRKIMNIRFLQPVDWNLPFAMPQAARLPCPGRLYLGGLCLGRVCLGILLAGCVGHAAHAQTYTWQQLRQKFTASNPTLLAGQDNIAESRTMEITAFLRP